jgi:hypothetical protein
MDLSCTRAPYNRHQYQGNNAYTNATITQDKYNNIADASGQQSYQHQRPKGPCFNCRKMGHFAKDCHSNPSSNISYMDAVDEDMQNVPQLNIALRANITQIKAQIDALSMEDNDVLIEEAMGSSQDFTPA